MSAVGEVAEELAEDLRTLRELLSPQHLGADAHAVVSAMEARVAALLESSTRTSRPKPTSGPEPTPEVPKTTVKAPAATKKTTKTSQES